MALDAMKQHPELLREEEKGTLGPVVIWVGFKPGSTSPETAHDVSQQVLALLRTNGVDDVVVEWREAEPRLAGFPLLHHVGTGNSTHHVRHFLTALLGVPLATEEMEDSQGILTLWFHENRDKNGDPSNKVYGVSNCHVLCKDTTVKYEHKVGAAKNLVRVCSMRRFRRGLDDITTAVSDHSILATYWAGDIAKLQAKQEQDPETGREVRRLKRNLEQEDEAIADLEALHDEVTKHWSDITLRRNIGYVQYAPAIRVNQGGTSYTSDWAAFVAAEAKVKDQFEGNVVDLGSKYSLQAFSKMFNPVAGGATTFKFPAERKLRIEGRATEGDLASPLKAIQAPLSGT
ncbi:hypothetical protein VNI00_005661 [Paramarasmius palmivorus]|uniref:Uncharacterized protein n=1 Tax=Paramarasmius palmivorus TaxID=297713 RepID=A0AAW0DFG7_9AGAR